MVFHNEVQNGISSLNKSKGAAPQNTPCLGPTLREGETQTNNPVVLSSKKGPPTSQWVPNNCSAQFPKQFLEDFDFIPTQNEVSFKTSTSSVKQSFPSQTYYTLLLSQIPQALPE